MFAPQYNFAPTPVPPHAGAYIDCALSDTALGTASIGKDIVRYYPLVIDSDMTLDQYCLEIISGAGNGAAVSYGIYDDNGEDDYYPGNPIDIQNNIVLVSGEKFCEKLLTAPLSALRGEQIWLALHCNSASVVTRSIPANTGSQAIIGRIKSPAPNGYHTGLSEPRPFVDGLPLVATVGYANLANISGNRLMLRQA